MRTVYRAFAYAVAVQVAVQASLIAMATAGLGHWVENGHIFDKSVMAATTGPPPYPEAIGFALHGINGTLIGPLIAVLLLVSSFFARVPGGVTWAAVVSALVAGQVILGYAAHGLPVVGVGHGLTALLLFAAALHAGHRARPAARATKSDVDELAGTTV